MTETPYPIVTAAEFSNQIGFFIAIPADAERVGTGIYSIARTAPLAVAKAEIATESPGEFIAVPATERLYRRIVADRGFDNLSPAFPYGLVEGVADILDG